MSPASLPHYNGLLVSTYDVASNVDMAKHRSILLNRCPQNKDPSLINLPYVLGSRTDKSPSLLKGSTDSVSVCQYPAWVSKRHETTK